jgi:TRAP-type mannitol/chloroaromatic compound transport system permease large subunit
MTREVFENSVRNTLGITCMFMWIILAALAFGAVFDGLGAVKAIENLVHGPSWPKSLGHSYFDAAFVYPHGDFSG